MPCDPKEDGCIHGKVKAVGNKSTPKKNKQTKNPFPLLLAPLAGTTPGSRGLTLPWLASGMQQDAAVAQLEWGERLRKAHDDTKHQLHRMHYPTSLGKWLIYNPPMLLKCFHIAAKQSKTCCRLGTSDGNTAFHRSNADTSGEIKSWPKLTGAVAGAKSIRMENGDCKHKTSSTKFKVLDSGGPKARINTSLRDIPTWSEDENSSGSSGSTK